MAIPFKSPISVNTIVPSSMEPTTKLTLGAYSIKLQSGTNTSIAINGSSSGSLTITSPDININNTNSGSLTITSPSVNITSNDKNILQHNSSQNLFGDPTVKAVLQGYPFYIAGDSVSEDVLASDENGITLSNNVKNTNIKGSNIVINGQNLTVPADTKLNSIVRALEPTSIACINDLGFKIIPDTNVIWPNYSPLVYIIPKSDIVDSSPDILIDKITIKLNYNDNSDIHTLQTFENISFMFAWRLKTENYQIIYCLYMKNDNTWDVYHYNFYSSSDLFWATNSEQFYLTIQKI